MAGHRPAPLGLTTVFRHRDNAWIQKAVVSASEPQYGVAGDAASNVPSGKWVRPPWYRAARGQAPEAGCPWSKAAGISFSGSAPKYSGARLAFTVRTVRALPEIPWF